MGEGVDDSQQTKLLALQADTLCLLTCRAVRYNLQAELLAILCL
jgi:hypothetical protein